VAGEGALPVDQRPGCGVLSTCSVLPRRCVGFKVSVAALGLRWLWERRRLLAAQAQRTRLFCVIAPASHRRPPASTGVDLPQNCPARNGRVFTY